MFLYIIQDLRFPFKVYAKFLRKGALYASQLACIPSAFHRIMAKNAKG